MKMQIIGHKEEILEIFNIDYDSVKDRNSKTLILNGVNFEYRVDRIEQNNNLRFETDYRMYMGRPTVKIEITMENLDKKALQDAKYKVQQAQRDFNKAQRELSKLQGKKEKTK